MTNIIIDIPGYIEARITQRPPAGVPVLPGATPVVSFGDVRKAKVATLGWNPSKREFLDSQGNELDGDMRRLETLTSVGVPDCETDLASASDDAVRRVFEACNNYFHRRPFRKWFDKLEPILKQVGASYYDGSACHLDLVQWATTDGWSDLSRSDQIKLIEADLPFLRRQLSQEGIRLLLLNGSGIVKAHEEKLGGKLAGVPFPRAGRLRLFTGRDTRGLTIVGWNINLQATFGVSNKEIATIGAEVSRLYRG